MRRPLSVWETGREIAPRNAKSIAEAKPTALSADLGQMDRGMEDYACRLGAVVKAAERVSEQLLPYFSFWISSPRRLNRERYSAENGESVKPTPPSVATNANSVASPGRSITNAPTPQHRFDPT